MMPAARHDVLVIADSDVHVRPDYLDRLVARFGAARGWFGDDVVCGPAVAPGYACRAGWVPCRSPTGFLPGALLSRAIGRQDCLGATMCLRRKDLERIGGFHALVDHLADDNVLGRRIAGLGLRVVLAQTVPLTTVPETGFPALFQHELRWARTIRALEPVGFAASIVQYPLAWVSADDRFGRRRAVVDRSVHGRLGVAGAVPRSGVDARWRRCGGENGPLAESGAMTRLLLHSRARSGFCRCETSCPWP